MRVELPRYPAYLPTESEWLAEMPEGWEAVQLARLNTKLTNGFVGPTRDILRDEGVRYLQSLHIKGGRIVFDTPYFVSEEWSAAHKKAILKVGDVLIVQTGDIGQVAAVTDEFAGCSCHALIIVRSKRKMIDGYFLSAVLRSHYGFHSLKSVQTGALHPHLNCTNIRDIYLPVPSLPDQRAILIFLDRETAKIDRLMAVRQKQVERLQELRTAVIHHAVNKGLDPDAKMKPSGIEWLGDVPANWNVYRLRHLLRPGKDGIRIGPFGSSLKAEFIRDEGYKVYGQENVIGRSFELGRRYVDEAKYSELREYLLRPGDVLITMMGSIGRCIVVPEVIAHGIMDSHLIRVGVDDRKIYPSYLALLIEAAPYVAACIQHESKGSIMDGLNSAIIKRLIILLPGLEDQLRVMEYVRQETSKFDNLLAKYQRELELLAEYRASLISHAVTGKIDVRGLVEPSPTDTP